jgi:hypothetical protein
MRQARATSKISDSRRRGSYQLQHAYNAACESRDGERIAYLLQSAPANAVDALSVFLDLLECEPERVGERPLSHPQMHASGAYLLPDMHVYRIWRLAPGRHDGHDFGTPRLRSLVAQKRYWKPQGFEDQLWGCSHLGQLKSRWDERLRAGAHQRASVARSASAGMSYPSGGIRWRNTGEARFPCSSIRLPIAGALFVLDQIDAGEDTASRYRPAIGKLRDHTTAEIFVSPQRVSLIAKSICEDGESNMRALGAVVRSHEAVLPVLV